MSAYIYFCPKCSQKLQAEEDLTNRMISCPECSYKFTVTTPKKKTHLEKAEDNIRMKISPGDSLIGYFTAQKQQSVWEYGSLYNDNYCVAVTQKGIAFHKLDFLGKFDGYKFFNYGEYESVQIGKGFLQRPITFAVKGGQVIKLRAQLKGLCKEVLITPELQNYIGQRIPLIQ